MYIYPNRQDKHKLLKVYSKATKILRTAVLDIISWKNLDSPQVKLYLIFSVKKIVDELPHELPSTLRLRILENQENIKIGSRYCLLASVFSRNKTFVIIAKNHAEGVLKFSAPLQFFT